MFNHFSQRGPAKILLGFVLALLLGAPASLFGFTNYVLFDNATGHILASKGRDERRQVASLTKIATATVVLDAAELGLVSLGEMVQVPSSALLAGGVNPAGLQAGDVLTLRDLLYAALLSSDNVSAATIAHHVGRKLPNPTHLDPAGNFVAHMNALARNLRMKRTLFLNPHGMDNFSGTLPFSTASDIGRLTRYAYSDADFRFFVSQKTRDIEVRRAEGTETIRLSNTNILLGQDGIDGVKTGMTSKSGFCLVLSSIKDPEVVRHGDQVVQTQRRVTLVLLGSASAERRFEDGKNLLLQGWRLHEQWAASGRNVNQRQAL
jgi:D-alanyl-D-alanine carboxypeptidase